MSDFYKLLENRFSCYNFSDKGEFDPEELLSKLAEVTELSPSAFNVQATRVVLVTGEKNKALWELIEDTQKQVMSEDVFALYKHTMENNAQGFGTVLLLEDRDAVEQMPSGEVRTEIYKEQNDAILAINLWLTLTDLGYGANLQHFNVGYKQKFDGSIKELLNLPENWELIAELAFGHKEEEHNHKEKISGKDRVFYIH